MAERDKFRQEILEVVMKRIQEIADVTTKGILEGLRGQVEEDLVGWISQGPDVAEWVEMEFLHSYWNWAFCDGSIRPFLEGLDIPEKDYVLSVLEEKAPTTNAMERIKDIVGGYTQEFYDSLQEDVADDVEAYNLMTSKLEDKALMALFDDLWDYLSDRGSISGEVVRAVTEVLDRTDPILEEKPLTLGDLLE